MNKIEPRKQGYFDYLCGVYSIINACRKANIIDENSEQSLFNDSIDFLNDNVILLEAVKGDGIYFKDMKPLLRHIGEKYGFEHSKPFKKEINIADFLKECADILKKGKSAIIIFLNKIPAYYPDIIPNKDSIDHWTVLSSVSKIGISLFDSYGYNSIRRADLESGICQIKQTYTILITKK
ncbi:hypothetical protein ADMFC3_09500 [Geovibrio sp. ADMFC3]